MLEKRAINNADIVIFFQQLATLFCAGIAIIKCLETLERNQTKLAFRLLIYAVKREILSGKDLSTSIQLQSHPFDHLTCQLIKIGERTGKLDHTLQKIAKYLESNLALQKNIKQILFYPLIIFLIAVLIMAGMFVLIIPHFAELFQHSIQNLPLVTRAIFYLSMKCKQYMLLLLIPPFLFVFLNLFFKTFSNLLRDYVKQCFIRLPLIKQLSQKMILARFARNLGIAFSSGIPIIDGLILMTASATETEFNSILSKICNKINTGLQLHQAMEAFTYFPTIMKQMIKIGEESGMLELMLDKVADFLDMEIASFINYLMHLLEPLIILVLGVLIGGIVIGLYLPIFKLGNAF